MMLAAESRPSLSARGIAGVLTMAEAARLVPSGHRRGVHPSTLVRWAKSGRLEVSLTPGGTMVTTEEALIRAMGIEPIRDADAAPRRGPIPATTTEMDRELDLALGTARETDHTRGRGRVESGSAPSPSPEAPQNPSPAPAAAPRPRTHRARTTKAVSP